MYQNSNNQKMYGGANKKQGLPPTVGLGRFASNLIQRKAGYCGCIAEKPQPTSTSTPTPTCPPNEITIPQGTI